MSMTIIRIACVMLLAIANGVWASSEAPQPTQQQEEKSAEKNRCAVCLSDLEAAESAFLVPCNHIFCAACVTDLSMSNHQKCPLCRKAIKAVIDSNGQRAYVIATVIAQQHNQLPVTYDFERDGWWSAPRFDDGSGTY